MSPIATTPHPIARALFAGGALMAAAAIALSAYASHVATPDAKAALQMAGMIGLAHGIALAALSPHAATRLARTALLAMLGGAVLFCGSLVAGHFHATSTALAPLGGGLMIVAWLLLAVAAWRG